MNRFTRFKQSLAILAIAPLALGLATFGTPTAVAQDATPAATPALDCSTVEPINVAFFGFAAANGFAQATWSGVQEAAAEMCATARFFDPNFDSATQVAQIQDAITSGEYQAFVIQANDGNSVVPVVEEAVAAGIVVVGEFTPIGTDYGSIEPQVEGMTSYVGTSIVKNGEGLAELGIQACESLGADPCKVAYLQGFRSLPLDNARTEAVTKGLEAAEGVELVASPEGGYTQASGLAAAQDVLQANPDVNVIIGSSQAILGAEQALTDAGITGVALIGNGAPRQAVAAVKDGRWFAVWADAESSAGKEAASVAIRAARGEEVPSSVDTTKLLPTPLGTKDNLPDDFEGQWDA
ncbi:MAG: sugar ABC transporter substrate-binding protein [Thermomicrobiales bacterium]